MLLQLRVPHMLPYTNCWDQAAAGHVDIVHSYEQAAAIEVAEEIGLYDVTLKTLGTYYAHNDYEGRIINQFVSVYSLRVPRDIVLRPEPEEVSKLQWFTPTKLRGQAVKHPEKFTPGLIHDLRQFYPSLQL